MSESVLLLDMDEGLVGFHIYDIYAILPDLKSPKTHSVVYSGLFPGGVTVKGKSEDNIGLWMVTLESDEEEPAEEEPENE